MKKLQMDRRTKVVAWADRLVATEREEEKETTPGRLRSVFDFVQPKPKEGMSAIPTPYVLSYGQAGYRRKTFWVATER